MKTIRKKRIAGMTLVEIMVAAVVIVVGVLGAAGHRYYSALDARKGDTHITAARIGATLLETWKATGGSLTFDPTTELASELTISTSSLDLSTYVNSETHTGDKTLLNRYKVVTNSSNHNYNAMLSYKDIASTNLRLLHVIIAWQPNTLGYQPGADGGGGNKQDETVPGNLQTVLLTTYVVH